MFMGKFGWEYSTKEPKLGLALHEPDSAQIQTLFQPGSMQSIYIINFF